MSMLVPVGIVNCTVRVSGGLFGKPSARAPKAPSPAPEPPPPVIEEAPEVQEAIAAWRRKRSIGSSRSTTLLTGGSGLGGFTSKKKLLGE